MTTTPRTPAWRRPALLASALFLAALAFRLLLRALSGDGHLPHGPAFQGDAVRYLLEAEALRAGRLFEWGLALRPPGTAHLLAWLWDGSAAGVAALRVTWCALGAALAPLLFLALRRRAGEAAALLAGALVAASHPLLVLANTLDAETPYLLLSVAALACAPARGDASRAPRELLRGALGGLACLFRAEHLALLLVLELVLLLTRRARPAGLALAAALLVLLPWQLALHARMHTLNTVEPARPPASERALQAVESLGASVSWSDAAAARRDAWPAFARRGAAAFVAATLAHRGDTHVDVADLELLRAAFDAEPVPLPEWPLLTGSTPLNLALAHHDAARRGFSRAPLERAPPLLDAPARFPAALGAGLPPQRLSLEYLPHLALLARGDHAAWRWVRANPGALFGHLLARARRFVHGAAGGYGGLAAPFGPSGPRAPADMLEAQRDTWWGTTLSLALLAAALLGLGVGGIVRSARRALRTRAADDPTHPARAELDRAPSRFERWPWLLDLALRFGVALLSFGYVRGGALAVPAVSVGLALLLVEHRRAALRWALGALLALALADAARASRGVRVSVDGRPPGAWPPDVAAPREVLYARSDSPAR